MRFRISGADRETAEDCTFEVDADTAQEARHKANTLGYYVSEVIPAYPATKSNPSTHIENAKRGKPQTSQQFAENIKLETPALAGKKDSGDQQLLGCLIFILLCLGCCISSSLVSNPDSDPAPIRSSKERQLDRYHSEGRFRGYNDAEELERDMRLLEALGSEEAGEVARELEKKGR